MSHKNCILKLCIKIECINYDILKMESLHVLDWDVWTPKFTCPTPYMWWHHFLAHIEGKVKMHEGIDRKWLCVQYLKQEACPGAVDRGSADCTEADQQDHGGSGKRQEAAKGKYSKGWRGGGRSTFLLTSGTSLGKESNSCMSCSVMEVSFL